MQLAMMQTTKSIHELGRMYNLKTRTILLYNLVLEDGTSFVLLSDRSKVIKLSLIIRLTLCIFNMDTLLTNSSLFVFSGTHKCSQTRITTS